METTAVPELRGQARDLAARLRGQKPEATTSPAPEETPETPETRETTAF